LDLDPRRPTDNTIPKRFYGTIKQEKIFVAGNYTDLRSAKGEISSYMAHYNDGRPHLAI
jgi:hypothetical protein